MGVTVEYKRLDHLTKHDDDQQYPKGLRFGKYRGRKSITVTTAAVIVLFLISLLVTKRAVTTITTRYDAVTEVINQSQLDISQNWGQYSPFFSVPSEISADIPSQCTVTFAQILSRHGARYPTTDKKNDYNDTIHKILHNVNHKHFTGQYAFLASYTYNLHANQLTLFGQQEMIDSGITFFQRYPLLSATATPFVRSSSEERVVESAQNWTQGFHQAKQALLPDPQYPYNITVICEGDHFNNTLNADLCTNFETGPDSKLAGQATDEWRQVFVPTIQTRLNGDLPGAKLNKAEVINLMDLCPFSTVASPTGAISPFCALFSSSEWEEYNYHGTLNKFYGFGAGNPLGPTQGVGFTNELIARLTGQPVQDHTSTNHTLDSSPATFPLGQSIYADFSHDNDMTTMFFAMGLYPNTGQLSKTSMESTQQTNGYSAAYTVPFSTRAYFEKLACLDHPQEEMIRVIVNDRVVPLQGCQSDALGRCGLQSFIDSLGFARSGGKWDQCFD